MRRKSERNKPKASPENKVEKQKRGRASKRRKRSSSSPDHELPVEVVPQASPEEVVVEKGDVAKDESPDADEDQVWHVKAAGTSNDSGEIQKLKICLARPPSTSDHSDKSPRASKKLNRSNSQTDSQTSESSDDRRRTRHHPKRNSKEELSTSGEIQDEEYQPTEPAIEVISLSQEIPEINVSDIVGIPSPDKKSTAGAFEVEPEKSVAATDKFEKPVDQTDNVTDGFVTDNIINSDPNAPSKDLVIIDKSHIETEIPHSDSNLKTLSEQVISPDPSSISRENSLKEEPLLNLISDNVVIPDENHVKDNQADSTTKNEAVLNHYDKSEDLNHTQDSSHTPEQERSHTPEIKRPVTPELIRQTSEPGVGQKKRRWGRTSKAVKMPIVNISTDSLKSLISDVQPVGLDDCHLEDIKPVKPENIRKESKIKIEKKRIESPERKIELKGKENKENFKSMTHRKISITNSEDPLIHRPPSPPRNMSSSVLYITNLVRPFTLLQLKNLLQRTGKIVDNGFWIDKIKSRCYVEYKNEDQAVETRHALHGVTWPVSNPKTLNVDFSNRDSLQSAQQSDSVTTVPITNNTNPVEAWVKDQDVIVNNNSIVKDELDRPWDKRRPAIREWDVGKGDIIDEGLNRENERLDRNVDRDRRKRRSIEISPEPAKKFKKKEDEAPAKLLDDLFRKTKTTPCIYWLPLSAEMIKVKEEQRRLHMAEHERRMVELRRTRNSAHQHSAHHRR